MMTSSHKINLYYSCLKRKLLEVLIVGKGAKLKIASIGQAIMQAARPRVLLAPLQFGLGVQMHHHFGSHFLIDRASTYEDLKDEWWPH